MLSLSFRDPEGIPLREIAWVLIDDVRFLFFYHVINWNVEFSSFFKKKKQKTETSNPPASVLSATITDVSHHAWL